MTRALVIHGHFYQPPRENPWTNYIDGEPSAAPYPDWNARIHAECYRPNAYARIMNGSGRIEDIVNNYSQISFNFGPTLLNWMQGYDPATYARILEADRISAAHNDGHGNAIAQAYNHTILPLCNARDRRTQVLWGIADFRHRFGRPPEALWLPETACNDATLGTLIDAGLRYVILSPYQAQRVRPLGADEGAWQAVPDGTIDPTQPYRCLHPDGSGRALAVFFYDGALARAVAFEGGLASSQSLVERLARAQGPAAGLVHTATDGESYGHHAHFGDRTLAHALHNEAPRRGFDVTNYGAFLAAHPPTMEVELAPGPDGEGTAWSCAHGVGRWYRDCGCHTGGQEGWNQHWRGPLREALNLLRDEAAAVFEAQGAECFHDPWAARDAYIDLVLDRGTHQARFLAEQARPRLGSARRVRALTLLELQRHAMLMFTSCGWFFSDLANLETVQVLKYAARVQDFLQELGSPPPTAAFLEALAEARSNVPAHGNGAEVWRQLVEPNRVTPQRLAAHLGISWLVEAELEEEVAAGYHFQRDDARKESSGRVTLATCRIQLENLATGWVHDIALAALHFGGIDFYCALQAYPGAQRFADATAQLWGDFHGASLPKLLRLVETMFGPQEYGLEHALPGSRRRIAERVLGTLVQDFSEQYARLYDDNRRIIEMLRESHIDLPDELRRAANYTLTKRFEEEIRHQQRSNDPAAYERAVEIAEEMAGYRLPLDSPAANSIFTEMIAGAVSRAIDSGNDDDWGTAANLVTLARRLHLRPSLEPAQDLYYSALDGGGATLSRDARAVGLKLLFAPRVLGSAQAPDAPDALEPAP